MAAESPVVPAYPVRLEIDYLDRMSRVTTFFRLILVIPAQILAILVAYATIFVSFAVFWTLLFRKRYPRWWFDFQVAASQYSLRVNAYTNLLTDRYPATAEAQTIHLEFDYPNDDAELSRWLPLVKWLLAIPHLIVLSVLGIIVSVVTVIAWFAILIVGRWPQIWRQYFAEA